MVAMALDVAEPGQLASRRMRLGAVLLDALITGTIVIAVGSYLAGGLDAVVAWSKAASPLQLFLANMAGFALYLLLHGYLLATHGQTIGKRLCGIRIVRADGQPAGLWRILLLRMSPIFLLSALPIAYLANVFALVDCLLIFRSSHKCLHDHIADTIVVNV